MLLFWKLVEETQMSKSLEGTRHHNSTKLLIFLPLRAIYFYLLHYETPCNESIMFFFLCFFKNLYQVYKTVKNIYKFLTVWADRAVFSCVFSCNEISAVKAEFKAEGWEFSNFLRSLEQFLQKVKGQTNFWNRMLSSLVPGFFFRSNILEQIIQFVKSYCDSEICSKSCK